MPNCNSCAGSRGDCLQYASAPCPTCEIQFTSCCELPPLSMLKSGDCPVLTNGDKLGKSCAVDGNHMIIGTIDDKDDASERLVSLGLKQEAITTGAVYIFEAPNGFCESATPPNLENWKVSKIVPGNLQADAKFGFSVDISGNYAIIGAPGIEAAFVLKKSGDTWKQISMLVPNVSDLNDAFKNIKDYPIRFGHAVAITKNLAVVGAPGADKEGNVFIFCRSECKEENKVVKEYFGNTCASCDYSLDPSYCFQDEGCLHLPFQQDAILSCEDIVGCDHSGCGGSTCYCPSGSSEPEDSITCFTNSLFGFSLALDQYGLTEENSEEDDPTYVCRLLIGAPGYSCHRGAAFMFEYDGGNDVFDFKADLTKNLEDKTFTAFGQAVDTDGVWAVVGAPAMPLPCSWDEATKGGRAYVFNYDKDETDDCDKWKAKEFCTPNSTEKVEYLSDKSEGFGCAVCSNCGTAIVGAPGYKNARGKINIYRLSSISDSGVVYTEYMEGLVDGDRFGTCMDLKFVPGPTTAGTNSGIISLLVTARQAYNNIGTAYVITGACLSTKNEECEELHLLSLCGTASPTPSGTPSGSSSPSQPTDGCPQPTCPEGMEPFSCCTWTK